MGGICNSFATLGAKGSWSRGVQGGAKRAEWQVLNPIERYGEEVLGKVATCCNSSATLGARR